MVMSISKPTAFKVTYKLTQKNRSNFLYKTKSSLIMRLLNVKCKVTVWSTSWSDYHKGLQMLHETFISLISRFLTITTLNTIPVVRTRSWDPNASSYWIWLFFCRLRDREKTHWGMGIGQRQKENNTAATRLTPGHLVSWRQTCVIGRGIRSCAVLWPNLPGWPALWIPIFHRKWGTVRQCPPQFQHHKKLMVVWMGLLPEIISTVCKVKHAPREKTLV